MEKLEKLKQLYFFSVSEMLGNPQRWKEFLQYAGNMYKYDFATLVTAFEQNKGFTQLATYDAWQSIGRQVKRDEKSIPVLLRNLNGVAHLFDVTQLYGNQKPWIWEIKEKDREEFISRFLLKNQKYQNEFYQSFEEVRENMIVEQWKMVRSKMENNIAIKNALMTDFLLQSVDYMVQYRCNCLTEEAKNHYFNSKPNEINEASIHTIGYYTIKAAREILLNSKDIVFEMRKEQEYERGQKNRDTTQWNADGIRREGRNLVRSSGRGTEQGVQQTSQQIRQSGNEILGGRKRNGFTDADDRGSSDGNHAQDSGESRGNDGRASGEDDEGRSDQGYQQHDGSIPAQTENPRSGGGNRSSGSNIQLELDFGQFINKDKEEEPNVTSSFLLERNQEPLIKPDGKTIEEMSKLKEEQEKLIAETENTLTENAGARSAEADSTQAKIAETEGTDSESTEAEIVETKNAKNDSTETVSTKTASSGIVFDEAVISNTKPDNASPQSVSFPNVIQAEKLHYHYHPDSKMEGGLKSKFQSNLAAIKLLLNIESDNRLVTREEQIILNRYVGWGGLSSAFDDSNSIWANEYRELKAALSEEEYKSARASTTTAFYTPPEIIQGIYQALQQFGFQGGNLLEPSLGIGRFFSHIPDTLEHSTKLYGVELDSISGRIARQLYQKADIRICGYEQASFPDNFFDAAIGNIPFGDYKVFDKQYKKYNLHIHDYFITKTIDKVRAGGVIAFITSKGTLDKANPSVRRYLAERVDLIGAIRLPNTVFKDANTEVTSDIIFFQKRERLQVAQPEWVFTGLTEDKIPVNQYFLEHPDMMLGKMIIDTKMFGEDGKYTALVNEHPEQLQEDFNKAIAALPAQIMQHMENEKENEEETLDHIPANPQVKNYCYTIEADNIYYRENSIMKEVKLSKTKAEQMKGLIRIRRAARDLIDAQLDNCSEEDLKHLQQKLETLYNPFVAKYGVLSGKSNTIFKLDADFPLLLSLEYNDQDNKVVRADIFYKRTIKPYRTVEHVETAREGLIVSMTEKGGVDIPYIAGLAGITSEQVMDELNEEIFLNPEKAEQGSPYAGYESADEYLSGNVRVKLKLAELFAKTNPVYETNIFHLKKVQPEDLTASEIEVRLGTTWIETEDLNQFMYELLETPIQYRFQSGNSYGSRATAIRYNSFTSAYSVTNKV